MSYSAYDETNLPSAVRVGSRRTYSRMSWGSVLAGAVVAGASMILLSLLGVAFGAGGLHFTQTTASDLAGYGLGAGIWTAINLILSMGFGAYVAARLSGTHSHLDAELHGITVWALAILLMTVLLAQAVGQFWVPWCRPPALQRAAQSAVQARLPAAWRSRSVLRG